LTTELRLAEPELRLDTVMPAGRAGPELVGASDATELVVIGRPATPGGQGTRATTHEVCHRARASVLLVPLPAVDGAEALAVRPVLSANRG
jgi:hypothetical protein